MGVMDTMGIALLLENEVYIDYSMYSMPRSLSTSLDMCCISLRAKRWEDEYLEEKKNVK